MGRSPSSRTQFLPAPTVLVHLLGLLGPTAVAGEPAAATRPEDLRPRIAVTESRILVLSAGALCRFHSETESWTTTTSSEGLPGGELQGFWVTGENIWVSCGDGAGVSDVRFDDWQCYRPTECYPGTMILDVEADDDYAYAGTDGGIARFDRYVLEWEILQGPGGDPLGSISDVAVGDGRVWFALGRGVAEFRKDAESFRIDSVLGELDSPSVLALRQTTRFLWAITDAGLARYDKDLQSWVSFRAGVDLPDARIHQLTMEGDDLWLGTDEGLWRYRADAGIWRRDESCDEMPGEQVLAFEIEPDRIWVVTESAFAAYERDAARWIDFSPAVPLAPRNVLEMIWTSGILMYVCEDAVAYGLSQGQSNPSLFTFRTYEFPFAEAEARAGDSGLYVGLDDAGLGVRTASGASLYLKGGATIYIEDDDADLREGSSGLEKVVAETRLDLTLSGRVGEDRNISGFYDSTDPDNTAYQLAYRGARSDILRSVNLGEIEEDLYNARLTPGTGLRGGQARAEFGPRSEVTHRRLVTADAWVGERRTLPGRDVFFGGNRTVDGLSRDIDYARGKVFTRPDGWTPDDMRTCAVYLDDADPSSNDPNTEHRELAGRTGDWDRLRSNRDYVLGPAGEMLILSAPLGANQALVAVHQTRKEDEVDLTDRWLRNHYRITIDPIPGSLQLALFDSTGSATDPSGTPYMEVFGLDASGDGVLDPGRFSPLTGLLSFPDTLPFPLEVYDDDPVSLFTMEYRYQTRLNTFRLSHRNLLPESERIYVDRELMRPNVDYSIVPSSGLFAFFEHVLLDNDTVIEIEYSYEAEETRAERAPVAATQIGVAPGDHFFLGMNTTRWQNDAGSDVTTANVNSRLEWKNGDRLLRLTPEIGLSSIEGQNGTEDATAAGIGLQGRYRSLELSATHRSLGRAYSSFEDRQTLLGHLREDSQIQGRWDLSSRLQAEVEWSRALSDSVAAGGPLATGVDREQAAARPTGSGEESSLMTGLRLLRSGLPNLVIRRGRVLLDAPGYHQEKWISRAELEISPEQAGINPLGIRRLWLRAFVQRSERRFSGDGVAESEEIDAPSGSGEAGKRTTDHAFVRLNGSLGSPLSWNVSFEDRRTHGPESAGSRNIQRFQELDASLQAQPHSSVDAFLRWESKRDLFWHPEGSGGGFGVSQLVLATAQLYPGRLLARLSPLSLRIDAGGSESEDGEPGLDLPGAESLWRRSPDASRYQRGRNTTLESRVQVLAWMRWVERWERRSNRNGREGLGDEGSTNRLENRLEIRPTGGLLTLRVIDMEEEEKDYESEKERQFSGQWDQTWGRGFLTYLSLDVYRTELRDKALGDRTHLWNPQARVTYRRARWQLDANLGGSLTWTRTKDTSMGVHGVWDVVRRQSINASLSVRPVRVVTVKLQYDLSRSERDLETPASESRRRWEIDHDLRLRLLVRV